MLYVVKTCFLLKKNVITIFVNNNLYTNYSNIQGLEMILIYDEGLILY